MKGGVFVFSAWFRLAILCLAILGAAGGLGELRLAVQESRPFTRKRRAQLWRFVSWSIALVLIVITETVRLGYGATWHTWGDFLVAATASTAVFVEIKGKGRKP